MTYFEENLSSGENILAELRPSMKPALIQAVAISIVTLGLGIVVTVPVFYLKKLANQFREIAVTDRRVGRKSGIIARRVDEFFIRQIESVEIKQGFVGRLFNYGSVLVHGTGGDPMVCVVDDPKFLKQIIDEALFPVARGWRG